MHLTLSVGLFILSGAKNLKCGIPLALQRLLHGLSGAHYADATVALAVHESLVLAACWRHHLRGDVRKLIQTLLDHHANQAVGHKLQKPKLV